MESNVVCGCINVLEIFAKILNVTLWAYFVLTIRSPNKNYLIYLHFNALMLKNCVGIKFFIAIKLMEL